MSRERALVEQLQLINASRVVHGEIFLAMEAKLYELAKLLDERELADIEKNGT